MSVSVCPGSEPCQATDRRAGPAAQVAADGGPRVGEPQSGRQRGAAPEALGGQEVQGGRQGRHGGEQVTNFSLSLYFLDE